MKKPSLQFAERAFFFYGFLYFFFFGVICPRLAFGVIGVALQFDDFPALHSRFKS